MAIRLLCPRGMGVPDTWAEAVPCGAPFAAAYFLAA
jgi:hypothetical protein